MAAVENAISQAAFILDQIDRRWPNVVRVTTTLTNPKTLQNLGSTRVTLVHEVNIMGEFSIFHWMIVLLLLLVFIVVPLVIAYRMGKKLGDQQGYIRGYKEGQQSAK